MNIETLLRSVPMTEDGGDFVQLEGQFMTPDEAFVCAKERDRKRPLPCPL